MPRRTYTLIQLTDLHLLADPAGRLAGWRVTAAFETVLAAARRRFPEPAGVLLTGDLVDDESPEGYRRLAELLRGWNTPLFAIPGNHDDAGAMAEHLRPAQIGGSTAFGDWRVHLLDSQVRGRVEGRIGEARRQALVAALTDAPSLIAVHHPPAPVGTPWIDALGLTDGDALLDLAAERGVHAIVSGHVHQAADFIRDGVRLLTTPATCRQFKPHSVEPAEDRDRPPGYRSLHLHPDGRLTTRHYRVPEAARARRD